jgi:hypothetical protein
MRQAITILTLSFCCNLYSANCNAQADSMHYHASSLSPDTSKKVFVRLYNQQHQRIADGHLLYSTDSMINGNIDNWIRVRAIIFDGR